MLPEFLQIYFKFTVRFLFSLFLLLVRQINASDVVVGEPSGQKYHFCTQGTFWYGESEKFQEPKIWPIWRLYDVIFQNGGTCSMELIHLTSSIKLSQIRGIRGKTTFRHKLLHSLMYGAPFGQ